MEVFGILKDTRYPRPSRLSSKAQGSKAKPSPLRSSLAVAWALFMEVWGAGEPAVSRREFFAKSSSGPLLH